MEHNAEYWAEEHAQHVADELKYAEESAYWASIGGEYVGHGNMEGHFEGRFENRQINPTDDPCGRFDPDFFNLDDD